MHKALMIGVAVLAVLLTVGVVALGLHLIHNSVEKNFNNKIAQIKTKWSYITVSKLSPSDKNKFNSYQANFDTSTEWNDNSSDLIQLCDFATLLIKLYNLKPDDKQSKEYLKLADDIIKKLNDRIFIPNNYSIMAKADSKIELLSTLLILLNTFDYLADDSYSNTKSICHDQILKIVPEFNKVYLGGVPESDLNQFYKDHNVIYTITARLLTNIKYNRQLYQYDIEKRDVIQILKNQFDFLSKSSDAKNHFYRYGLYYSAYEVLSSDQLNSLGKLVV